MHSAKKILINLFFVISLTVIVSGCTKPIGDVSKSYNELTGSSSADCRYCQIFRITFDAINFIVTGTLQNSTKVVKGLLPVFLGLWFVLKLFPFLAFGIIDKPAEFWADVIARVFCTIIALSFLAYPQEI